ncbi:MAG: hypothetical protein JXR91_13330 [Deltaproteobacteria bacterium]|nr:hypothetical protein [Deltaproteobacteria bacterium]
MKKRKETNSDDPPSDAWMGTMSDLVFLLITFFVLLISMSSLDSKALKETFGFFDSAVGLLKFDVEPTVDDNFMEMIDPFAAFLSSKTLIPPLKKLSKGNIESSRELIRKLANGVVGKSKGKETFRTLKPLIAKTGGAFYVERRKDGISFLLSYRLLFKDGTSDLDDAGKNVLNDMSRLINAWDGDVHIEAVWAWNEGPKVLASITEYLQKQWIKGDRMYPELYGGWDRSIRFYLKKRNV